MASDKKRTNTKPSFREVLLEMEVATRRSHGQAAAMFGISGKTLTRYMSGHVPVGPRRRDLLRRLEGVSPALHARFAAALELEQAALPAAAPVMQELDPLVRMAIYSAADEHDLTPAKAREVVRAFLGMMVEHGIDAKTARAALPAKRRE